MSLADEAVMAQDPLVDRGESAGRSNGRPIRFTSNIVGPIFLAADLFCLAASVRLSSARILCAWATLPDLAARWSGVSPRFPGLSLLRRSRDMIPRKLFCFSIPRKLLSFSSAPSRMLD